MINKSRVLAALISCALLVSACSCGNNVESISTNTLVITDIHLDPFTSCGESNTSAAMACVTDLINESNVSKWNFPVLAKNKFGDETNQAFLESGLTNLTATIKNQQIKNIFVTGDLLSHHFTNQFDEYVPNGTSEQRTQLALNTMNYVLYKISKAVPNVKMYYILGNNDTDEADYAYPSESFMAQVTPMIKNYMVSPNEFAKTFSLGGYSKMPFNANVDVIGLNFNPITSENSGDSFDESKALTQYAWLSSQLAEARIKHKKIIILQHEPFGVNVFNIIDNYSPIVNLQAVWQQKYIDLYTSYKDVITNFYYGHYHMENITVVNGIFSFSTLGFSVDFYNNPGFKILNISPTGALQNFTAYYSKYHENDKLTWDTLYQLNEEYDITPSQYVDYFESGLKVGNNKAWINYSFIYGGRNLLATESNLPNNFPRNWPSYYCSIVNYDLIKYNECLNSN